MNNSLTIGIVLIVIILLYYIIVAKNLPGQYDRSNFDNSCSLRKNTIFPFSRRKGGNLTSNVLKYGDKIILDGNLTGFIKLTTLYDYDNGRYLNPWPRPSGWSKKIVILLKLSL